MMNFDSTTTALLCVLAVIFVAGVIGAVGMYVHARKIADAKQGAKELSEKQKLANFLLYQQDFMSDVAYKFPNFDALKKFTEEKSTGARKRKAF